MRNYLDDDFDDNDPISQECIEKKVRQSAAFKYKNNALKKEKGSCFSAPTPFSPLKKWKPCELSADVRKKATASSSNELLRVWAANSCQR